MRVHLHLPPLGHQHRMLRPERTVSAASVAAHWTPSTIRRQLSVRVRTTAIAAALLCVLATAPAASARSVAGEYTPAATLTTEAPVVFSGVTDRPTEALVDTPLLTPTPAAAVTSAPAAAPAPIAAASPAPEATPAPESPASTADATVAAATPAPIPADRQIAIATAIAAARSKLGAPYSYGSAGPYAFDCSGFTRWVFLQAGITLPHYSGAQWAGSIRIPLDQLQPGDLVFNWGFGGGDPDHVGLYLGDGMMIHSPNGGGSVRYDSIWWWTGATIAAGRIR